MTKVTDVVKAGNHQRRIQMLKKDRANFIKNFKDLEKTWKRFTGNCKRENREVPPKLILRRKKTVAAYKKHISLLDAEILDGTLKP